MIVPFTTQSCDLESSRFSICLAVSLAVLDTLVLNRYTWRLDQRLPVCFSCRISGSVINTPLIVCEYDRVNCQLMLMIFNASSSEYYEARNIGNLPECKNREWFRIWNRLLSCMVKHVKKLRVHDDNPHNGLCEVNWCNNICIGDIISITIVIWYQGNIKMLIGIYDSVAGSWMTFKHVRSTTKLHLWCAYMYYMHV